MNQMQIRQTELIKDQTFGVEVEMYGISRAQAARVAAEVLGAGKVSRPGAYLSCDLRVVKTADGREWEFMRDPSVKNSSMRSGAEDTCEMVTPVLRYEDIGTLQAVLRALRDAGAKSDAKHMCGIHVHVGADGHTAHSIRMLCNLMASHEDILIDTLNLDHDRVSEYCKVIDPEFLKLMNEERPETLEDVKGLWYSVLSPSEYIFAHYNSSRYHMLNLHALFTKGTIEFRLFQFDNPTDGNPGGINVEQLKAYIQLSLAMNARAKIAKRTAATPSAVQKEDPHGAMIGWLKHLCLVGPEFKEARTHTIGRIARAARTA